jgi:hypothetical protein
LGAEVLRQIHDAGRWKTIGVVHFQARETIPPHTGAFMQRCEPELRCPPLS